MTLLLNAADRRILELKEGEPLDRLDDAHSDYDAIRMRAGTEQRISQHDLAIVEGFGFLAGFSHCC